MKYWWVYGATETLIHYYDGIHLHHSKGRTTDTHNMNKSQKHYPKWKKPDTNILHNFI